MVGCMKEYLVRIDDNGVITEFTEMGEDDDCDRCYDCEQLEAAMLAIISSLREEIGMLKMRVSELEKRPTLTAEPLMPYREAPWASEPDWLPKIYFTCRT